MFNLKYTVASSLRRHIAMGFLILSTTIGFNVMRGMRETIVFQFGKNGALYTPFIRIFCILPISAFLFVYYLAVKKRTNTKTAYYAVTLPLLAYFVGYGCFGNHQPIGSNVYSPWVESAIAYYPPFEFMAGIVLHWDKTLYYVFCEAWGSFTLVILFWQIANETYQPNEAKRYYPIFSMLGGVGIILSSLLITEMGRQAQMMQITTQVISFVAIINCLLVSWIWKNSQHKISLQTKQAISMRQGLKLALQTPHVLYLTVCIISFSVLCNVYENAVRNIILNYYTHENDVFQFWGQFFLGKGLLVIFANLISRTLLKRIGWFWVAVTTPIISISSIHLILSIPSFHLDQLLLGQTHSLLWLLAALLQLNFAVKYAFFDPTKEMAYIPLSPDQKTYGKTVADGLGSRIGNIGSGVVQSIAIVVASGSEFAQIAPVLLITCSMLSLGWIWAMRGLTRTYRKMTAFTNAVVQEPAA